MKRLNKVIFSVLVMVFLISGVVSAAAYTNYKDIKDSDWYADAVDKLSEMNIVNGMTDGSFKPQGEVTRAQFVKMLVQAMEYNKIDSVSFTDMKANSQTKAHWASVYVETALRNGVISKPEEGDRFYPDVPITREDMVMMIFRALKLEPSAGVNPYYDLEEQNGYFTKVYEEYLVRGIPLNGKIIFNPTGVTTRAQAAVIISRLVDYKADPEGFIAKMGMEERFRNGTQTAEDIALKRQMEIAQAKADPNYIMEPIITVDYNSDPWEYEYFRMYFDNIDDYSIDCKWKFEVVNYKQLNSFEMPRPDGTFVKYNITDWKTFGDSFEENSRACFYILGKTYYTTQVLIKDFKLYPSMKIEFKITVKKGTNERVIYKTVTVNDIKFKG